MEEESRAKLKPGEVGKRALNPESLSGWGCGRSRTEKKKIKDPLTQLKERQGKKQMEASMKRRIRSRKKGKIQLLERRRKREVGMESKRYEQALLSTF